MEWFEKRAKVAEHMCEDVGEEGADIKKKGAGKKKEAAASSGAPA